MQRSLNLLEEKLKFFLEEEDPQHFYDGLVAWLSYLDDNPVFQELIVALESKKVGEYSNFRLLEQKALKELDESKSKLEKIIEDNEVQNDSIQRLLNEEYVEYREFDIESGLYEGEKTRVASNRPIFISIENTLFDIAVILAKEGFADSLSAFIDHQTRRNNVRGNFVFSDSYFEAVEELRRIDSIKEHEPWFHWDELKRYLDIYKASPSWHNYFSRSRVHLKSSMKRVRWSAKFLHLALKEMSQKITVKLPFTEVNQDILLKSLKGGSAGQPIHYRVYLELDSDFKSWDEIYESAVDNLPISKSDNLKAKRKISDAVKRINTKSLKIYGTDVIKGLSNQYSRIDFQD